MRRGTLIAFTQTDFRMFKISNSYHSRATTVTVRLELFPGVDYVLLIAVYRY
jgi:hypothetical protein